MRSGRLPVAARTCSARGPGCFAGHQFGPFVLLARSEEREQLGRVQTKSPGLLEQQLSGDVGVIAGPEPDHDIKMPRFTALVDQAAKHEQQSRSGQGQGQPVLSPELLTSSVAVQRRRDDPNSSHEGSRVRVLPINPHGSPVAGAERELKQL